MLYRHVFDKISTEFRGIFEVFFTPIRNTDHESSYLSRDLYG